MVLRIGGRFQNAQSATVVDVAEARSIFASTEYH